MDGKLHIDMFPQLNSGLSKMRELTKKQPNFLHEKERCYKTEAHSFFTTFYNLNWDANDKILAEEVANRVNSTLEKHLVNEEKFGVNNVLQKNFIVEQKQK
ncbi:putative uncharacterized protein [Bacteroides fragilis CAG:558]|nr:putative uncharacterized protein [Bacteroides fragilis CAG:558]